MTEETTSVGAVVNDSAIGSGSQLGAYRLEARLGEGAFGRVFAAVGPNGRVAIKVARTEPMDPGGTRTDGQTQALACITGGVVSWDPDPVNLLTAEAAFLQDHAGPGLVPLIADNSRDTVPHLVLAHVAGPTLRSILGQRPLAPLLLQIVATLARLAQKGVGHGDLKPENLILDANGQAVLIDPAWPHQTHHAAGVFQPFQQMESALFSPEYNPFGADSDLPALGVMLLEAHAGVNPFTADMPTAPGGTALNALISDRKLVGQGHYARRVKALCSPRAFRPALTDAVEAISLRCLGLTRDADGVLMLDPRPYDLAHLARDLSAITG